MPEGSGQASIAAVVMLNFLRWLPQVWRVGWGACTGWVSDLGDCGNLTVAACTVFGKAARRPLASCHRDTTIPRHAPSIPCVHQGKVAFVAPARWQLKSQVEACQRVTGLDAACISDFSSASKQEARKEAWSQDHKRAFFCTPATLWSDVKRGACGERAGVERPQAVLRLSLHSQGARRVLGRASARDACPHS